MAQKRTVLSLAVASALLLAIAPTRAQELDAETKARIEKAEAGPSEIDVSKYPAKLQDAYKVFSQKCSQCHKLSRPINSEFALPEEWERYVKRMMRKPDSGIDAAVAKSIYELLVYDASVRKKDLLDKKLAALSAEERQTNTERLNKVKQTYAQ
ncbi:MAG: hypothetical protein HY699_25005 [Deltaproteobacteria bacterium]|nr:hypothetical protein [Deltaproteobacteria bacterium]